MSNYVAPGPFWVQFLHGKKWSYAVSEVIEPEYAESGNPFFGGGRRTGKFKTIEFLTREAAKRHAEWCHPSVVFVPIGGVFCHKRVAVPEHRIIDVSTVPWDYELEASWQAEPALMKEDIMALKLGMPYRFSGQSTFHADLFKDH